MRLIDADKLGLTDFEIILCDGDYKEVLKQILCKIELAPTIDAEPIRHGKWQIYEVFDVKDMTCSSCGWLYEYYAGMEEEWNYCPHCGAKMNEVEE